MVNGTRLFYVVSVLMVNYYISSLLQIFISESYDATSHFETTCLDVLDIFRRGTGEDFDFSKVKHDLGDEQE